MKSINTKIVIAELHRAFKMFNENFFGGSLQEPAILIQSRGNKKLTLGWCSVGKIWKNETTHEERYEINIVAEALNRGIYPVMTTFLHEMVHLYNLQNGIKDTSRGNTYHNMKFKTQAEAHGLIIEHADKIGWSVSKLNGFAMDLIDENRFDEAVFSLGRRDMDLDGKDKKRKKKKTSSRKYTCPLCGTSVRASKDVFLLCGDCTNIEKGKVVPMLKEPSEDDEDEAGTDAPAVEYICLDCGTCHSLTEEPDSCPECGGDIVPAEEIGNYVETPADEEEEIEEPEEVETLPKGITEEPTQLDDGAGNMVDVIQGKITVEEPIRTDWSIAQIETTMNILIEAFRIKRFRYVTIDNMEFEISDKMKSQWASYKEGKKFTFSTNFLATASESEIIDCVNHQYIHHYQFMTEGLKANHRADFKALCGEFGISTEVPQKNHRPMK